jgi:hypothetical protein
MAWKSKTLPNDECNVLQQICPKYQEYLQKHQKSTTTVDEFIHWITNQPEIDIIAFKGDRGKKQLRDDNPDKHIINAQNSLYHLSGNSQSYQIHDSNTGKQVAPLLHIDEMTYRLR